MDSTINEKSEDETQNPNNTTEIEYEKLPIPDQDRIAIIREIWKRFTLLYQEPRPNEVTINFQCEKNLIITEVKKSFKYLKHFEISYILFSFYFSKDRSVKNILNFLDTMNSIFSHFEYYKKKNKTIRYNNAHFDNYLLKRYECADIFTNFLLKNEARELKIDNKLYFNYIPLKCAKRKHISMEERENVNEFELEKCEFAHNSTELKFHPFVYKKFKCFDKICKLGDECPMYHGDENENDMETEVDFDSKEMQDLQILLSTLKIEKKDIKNNELLSVFLEQKSKNNNNYIPTEFNPKTYKMYECPLGKICKLDKKLCLNYHNDQDRRRNPHFYECKLCPNLYDNNKRIPNAKCKDGDDCNFAHNLYEYFYHPNKFRTIKCKQEKNGKYCKERLICPYYHKSDEICETKDGIIFVDENLVYDYYKSMIISHEKNLNSKKNILDTLTRNYLCAYCHKHVTNILNSHEFYVEEDTGKIVCDICMRDKNIQAVRIDWENK